MAARTPAYASSVFINCPFDDDYAPILNAVVFSIFDCGFVPRCALEVDDGGDVRFDKVQRLISESKYGIHDISRTELDAATNLPRFNMPLELGVFLAAKRYGNTRQKQKNCMIMDREQYRYRDFISDISGHDIRSHANNPAQAVRCVRDWLNSKSGRRTIPGGTVISARYGQFQDDLPEMCAAVAVTEDELTYNDYTNLVSTWLSTQDAED